MGSFGAGSAAQPEPSKDAVKRVQASRCRYPFSHGRAGRSTAPA
jgi:hypothetical protein